MTLVEYLAEVRERVERAKSSNLVPYLRSVVEDNQHMTTIIEEQAKVLEVIAEFKTGYPNHVATEAIARIDAFIAKGEK